PKELVLVPKARHLCCSFTDPEMYERKLKEFFEKYDR
ncbi:MAG TPA: cell surface protein, partial [Lachnospiraceae bacterium]|nr:cell surface protein [Lachnospiraceae bacterium]